MAGQGHAHDWVKYWAKCKVLKQQFTRTQASIHVSGAHRVTCICYKEIPHIFTVNDMVMSENVPNTEAHTTKESNDNSNLIVVEDMQPSQASTTTQALSWITDLPTTM